MNTRRRRVCAALLVAIPILIALRAQTDRNPVSDVPAGLERFYTQQMAWASCSGVSNPIFQCARMTVPLDYSVPGGPTIQIAVIRAKATKAAHRIGSLVMDPGGPGVSGVSNLVDGYPSDGHQPSGFDAQLQDDFDIVSFDPRGVGQSEPILCKGFPPDSPDTAEEVAAQEAREKAFVAGCETRSGMLLPHVGTLNVARDVDVLRAVLGDHKLNYLGWSYGTYLGQTYIGLFPLQVGRVVLDGPIPTDLTRRQMDIGQIQGLQSELNQFIADCVTRPDCPLGTILIVAEQKLYDLFATIKIHPLSTDSPNIRMGYHQVRSAVESALYGSPGSWPDLRHLLTVAMDGKWDRSIKPQAVNTADGSQALVAIDALDIPTHVHSVSDAHRASA